MVAACATSAKVDPLRPLPSDRQAFIDACRQVGNRHGSICVGPNRGSIDCRVVGGSSIWMTGTTMKARETARQNLRRRIEKLLGGGERVVIPGWQAGMVLLAIEQTRAGDFATAERTVMKAEQPSLWQWSTPVEGAIPLRRDYLVKMFQEALTTE